MIPITITSEKFHNCPAPEITEKMIDWVLLTLRQTVRDRCPERIESVNIRANQSYKGANNIHFYITFNDDIETEFHKEYMINLPLWLQNPQLGHDFYEADGIPEYGVTWNDEPKGRWYWVEMFVSNGVDMGEDGIEFMRRTDELKRLGKIKDQQRKEKEQLENDYNLYLRLKEKFKNYKPVK